MMKRILVPLDGSPLAERALATAAQLARSGNGTLILVQAMSFPADYDSLLVPHLTGFSLQERIRTAQAYLSRCADLPVLSGIPVETRVWDEEPALSILNASTECRAGMIVMTSHGRTGFGRWILGSVAEHVTRQAELPVLVLRQRPVSFWPGEAHEQDGRLCAAPAETLPPLRVLVPLDGSPLAESALDPAASCASALAQGSQCSPGSTANNTGCLLHLVLVVRPFDAIPNNMPEALVVSGAKTYLSQAAERLHDTHPDVAVTTEVIAEGDVASALIAIVESGDDEYSLLAMATHGRAGIMRWVWGSITERVVQKTQLPILLVRPR